MCSGVQGRARGVHGRARACKGVHGRVEACTGVQGRARACKGVHGRVEACVQTRLFGVSRYRGPKIFFACGAQRTP